MSYLYDAMAKIYSEYSNQEPNNSRELMSVRPEILKARFLELYMITCHVNRTCQILGLVPRTVYHWKKNDPQFNADWKAAEEVAVQTLEDETVRRAVHGVEKPVYQGGKLVGSITEYSDTLLMMLLRGRLPNKYKDKVVNEHTGPDGKPLLNDFKIHHVHSQIPLASAEDEVLGQELEKRKAEQRIESNTLDIEPIEVKNVQKDTDNLDAL